MAAVVRWIVQTRCDGAFTTHDAAPRISSELVWCRARFSLILHAACVDGLCSRTVALCCSVSQSISQPGLVLEFLVGGSKGSLIRHQYAVDASMIRVFERHKLVNPKPSAGAASVAAAGGAVGAVASVFGKVTQLYSSFGGTPSKAATSAATDDGNGGNSGVVSITPVAGGGETIYVYVTFKVGCVHSEMVVAKYRTRPTGTCKVSGKRWRLLTGLFLGGCRACCHIVCARISAIASSPQLFGVNHLHVLAFLLCADVLLCIICPVLQREWTGTVSVDMYADVSTACDVSAVDAVPVGNGDVIAVLLYCAGEMQYYLRAASKVGGGLAVNTSSLSANLSHPHRAVALPAPLSPHNECLLHMVAGADFVALHWRLPADAASKIADGEVPVATTTAAVATVSIGNVEPQWTLTSLVDEYGRAPSDFTVLAEAIGFGVLPSDAAAASGLPAWPHAVSFGGTNFARVAVRPADAALPESPVQATATATAGTAGGDVFGASGVGRVDVAQRAFPGACACVCNGVHFLLH